MSTTHLYDDRDALDAVDPAATLDPAAVPTPPTDAAAGADLENPDPTDLDANDTPDADDSDDEDNDSSKASRDAARYRRQLRATESRLQAAEARLKTLQRQRVEDIAARVLPEPVALWDAGTQLPDLLDDAGDLDPEKIADAARTVANRYGIPPRRPVGHAQQLPRTNLRSLGGALPMSAADRFTEAFKPKH